MEVAEKLWREKGLMTTLDLLAEDIHLQETADKNLTAYLGMVDAAAGSRFADGAGPTLSLKPSSYTTAPLEQDGDAAGSREAIARIAEHAKERGVRITVDMESRHWTDFTLKLVKDLHREGHDHVGPDPDRRGRPGAAQPARRDPLRSRAADDQDRGHVPHLLRHLRQAAGPGGGGRGRAVPRQ